MSLSSGIASLVVAEVAELVDDLAPASDDVIRGDIVVGGPVVDEAVSDFGIVDVVRSEADVVRPSASAEVVDLNSVEVGDAVVDAAPEEDAAGVVVAVWVLIDVIGVDVVVGLVVGKVAVVVMGSVMVAVPVRVVANVGVTVIVVVIVVVVTVVDTTSVRVTVDVPVVVWTKTFVDDVVSVAIWTYGGDVLDEAEGAGAWSTSVVVGGAVVTLLSEKHVALTPASRNAMPKYQRASSTSQ